MPRSAITHSGRLVARIAALSPFWSPRLSRPPATARTRRSVSRQVRACHWPPRLPDMASASGVEATRCKNISTTERNVGSLMRPPEKRAARSGRQMIARTAFSGFYAIDEQAATEVGHARVARDPGEGAGRHRHHPSAREGHVTVAVEEVGADGDQPGLVRTREVGVDPVEGGIDVAEVGEPDAVDSLVVHVLPEPLQPLAPVEVRVEEDLVPPAAGEEVEVVDRVGRGDQDRQGVEE